MATPRPRPRPTAPDEPPAPLPLAEWVCLALVHSGASHGWTLVKELAPDGAIGGLWSLSRQLTYRAVEQLAAKGMVERSGEARGRGSARVLLTTTAAGRDAVGRWLDMPVVHVRDVRHEGLLKLALRDRLGLDNLGFLRRQQTALAPVIDSLLGPAHAGDDLAELHRRETARATQRFLQAAIDRLAARTPPSAGRPFPRLSARNQLAGRVTLVTHGDLLTSVRVTLDDGQLVTATITREAAEELALAPGDPVTAIVKATEVLLAAPG